MPTTPPALATSECTLWRESRRPRLLRNTAGVHELRAPILEIVAKNLRGRTHDGHDTLLVALAHDAQNLLVEKDAAQVKAAKLRDAQAAAVEDLDDRMVALPRRGLREGLVEKGSGLVTADNVRQAVRLFGKRQIGSGMSRGYTLGHHKTVKALDS